MALTFAPPLPPSRPRLPPAARRRSPPRWHLSSRPLKARLHGSNQSILLTPARSPPTDTQPCYIACPSCHVAYMANALQTHLTVRCPHCKHSFPASPAHLLVPYTATTTTTTTTPPSPADVPRDAIVCPHISLCSGCTRPQTPTTPDDLAQIAQLARAVNLTPPAARMHTPIKWRLSAKLAVRNSLCGLRIGLYRTGTHQVVDIPECAVHAPEINAMVDLLRAAFRAARVSAYEEQTGRGDIRYVLLSVGNVDRRVMVTIVWNAESWKAAGASSVGRVTREIQERGGKDLHSLWFNWNDGLGNAIVKRGRAKFYRAWGDLYLKDRIFDLQFFFSAYTFRQANLDAFAHLVLPAVLQFVPVGCKVSEFCAGVGVIGLVAMKERRLKRLVASEIDAACEPAFWKTARSLRNARGKVHYVVGSDWETRQIAEHADVIIVDPPRAGLTPRFVEWLAGANWSGRLIYVACGTTAFCRDVAILVRAGWSVVALRCFALFPGSEHVETVGVLHYDPSTPHTRGTVRR